MDITRPTCSNSRDVFSVETGRKTSQVVRESEGSDGVAVRTFSPGGKISAWKKTRRTVFGLVLGALFSLHFQVLAAGSVTLAWSPSTDPAVAGYNIYYGGAHGVYTNKIAAGMATKVTISGLIQGTTY